MGLKNPFKKSHCAEKTCPLCTKSQFIDVLPTEVKIPCNSNNVGYRWLCVTCKERDITKVYEGETGRSARIRGAEHLRDLEKQREKSVLYKHKLTDHGNEDVNLAVRIYSRPSHETLNSK